MRCALMMAAFAALLTGCSHTDQTLESVSGTEPQRLSFGAPEAVQATFMQKMKACWFGGDSAPLHGYRFEAQTAANANPMMSPSPAASGYENIKIYDESKKSEAFEVQFHKYNNNTLISTRNLGLPLELASKLKKDIETWLLRTSDCE